jgi:hypothetical protein
MRRTLSLLVSAAAAAGLYASLAAAPASAVLTCPDGHAPIPEGFVHNGFKKDHNDNGFVCAKPTTCLQPSGPVCHGGPDDDDVTGVPLFGSDGNWYYVVDDTEV